MIYYYKLTFSGSKLQTMRQGVRWSSEGRMEDNGVGASRPHTTRAVRDKVVVETGQGAGDGRGSLRSPHDHLRIQRRQRRARDASEASQAQVSFFIFFCF